MKSRISTILAAAALMIVLATTPAYAIFGAITGALQRAQMIINQGIQIYEQQVAKLTMDGQLTELTSQFDHLKEQAMGSVGKITQPFTDLSSAPAKLIGNGISWKNEFAGVAGEFVSSIEQLGETGTSFTDSWRGRIQGSNTVTETDLLNLYAGHNPEVGARASLGFLAAQEAGDTRLVLNHATSDAAGNLMLAAREAAESYTGLRNNTNTSNTALAAQAQVSGLLTQGTAAARFRRRRKRRKADGRPSAGVCKRACSLPSPRQLMAFQAAKEAAEGYEQEIARREALARFLQAEQEARLEFRCAASRDRGEAREYARGPALYHPRALRRRE